MALYVQPDNDDSSDEEELEIEASSASGRPVFRTGGAGQTPPIPGPFRIGYPGRGIRRGG
jgi:hypothetical protein